MAASRSKPHSQAPSYRIGASINVLQYTDKCTALDIELQSVELRISLKEDLSKKEIAEVEAKMEQLFESMTHGDEVEGGITAITKLKPSPKPKS